MIKGIVKVLCLKIFGNQKTFEPSTCHHNLGPHGKSKGLNFVFSEKCLISPGQYLSV